MKLTSTRLFSALVPLALVAGCSAAPDAGEERTGSASSAILIGNPPIFTIDPSVLCSSSAPNFSYPLPIFPSEENDVLTGDPSASCTYGVVEVTGTQGKELFVNVSAPGTVTSGMTQAECEKSSFSYDIFGYLPGHLVVTGVGMVELTPGTWQSFTVADATTTPSWESGTCIYNLGFSAENPLQYTKVRIATQAFQYDGTGNHRILLDVAVTGTN